LKQDHKHKKSRKTKKGLPEMMEKTAQQRGLKWKTLQDKVQNRKNGDNK